MKQKELSSPPWPEGVPSAAKELAIDRQANLTAGHLRGVLLVVFGLGLLAFTNSALSANWYVRPSSAGANNGTDWNNAWSVAGLNSSWASVTAGDTIWLAGGTYGTGITFTKSGTAANLIYVKRVKATDATPVAAAGWTAGFDSQVIFSPSSWSMSWPTVSAGSYVYIDGREDSGIKMNLSNTAGETAPVAINSGKQTDITFTNLDMAGPAPNSTAYAFNYYCKALDIRCWNGSAYNTVTNINVMHCRLHGVAENVMMVFVRNITFDHCKFYDANPSSTHHQNVWEANGCQNVDIRYCEIWACSTEGYRPYGNHGPTWIYGCVWHSNVGTFRCVEPDSSVGAAWGPLYYYNNTHVDIPLFVLFNPGGYGGQYSYKAGSEARNNIIWNSGGMGGGYIDSDYNYGNTTFSGETHSIGSATVSPFQNYAGKDYQIVSNISAVLPRDKGVALNAPYNLDKYGNLRGADGAWDIGAYESGGAASTNTAPTVSSITNNAADVDPNIPGPQVLEGTVVQYSGTASDPDHYPLSQLNWQWIYTVNGGGEVVFQSGTGTVNPATFIYGAGTGGNTYNWKLRVSDGEAWAESQLTVGVKAAPVAGGGLTFEAESVAVTAPFITNNSSTPIYIYQSSNTEANLQAGGRAAYTFTITTAGSYVIQAVVNAPNDAQNSFFVNIDSEAQDLTNSVWQIPITSGFEARIVNWQGNGTWNNPQLVPKIFNLTNGTHQLIFRGREANTQLDRFAILKLPATVQGLRVVTP